MLSTMPMRRGLFKNQMWRWDGQLDVPHALARTLDSVTSTPQRSQTMPLNFTQRYLPQAHS